jgi:hypothetical protein
MTVSEWYDTSRTSVSDSVSGAWDNVGDVIGAVLIILVGLVVAYLVRWAVEWVAGQLQVGRWMTEARLNRAIDTRMNWTGLLGDLAQWFVIIAFLIPALAVLGIGEGVVDEFLDYIPVALLAAFVVLVGFVFADLASRVFGAFAMLVGAGSAGVVSATIRYAIWIFTGVIALEVLGVDRKWIDDMILGAIAAGALAAGLAFGLGGRDAATGSLKRWSGMWPKDK